MRELLVILPASTAYRAPFFDRVVPILAQEGIRLTVAHSGGGAQFAHRGDVVEHPWSRTVPVREGPGRQSSLEYRRWRSARVSPDLVIVQQAIKNLETYPLLARQHFGGPGVAMWGHGRSYSTPQGPRAAALKQLLTRRAQWFFAYTQGGADHVISEGFPATRVSVLNNTIDTDALQADLDRVSDDELASFQRELGLTPGRTALFLGGVDRAKGISYLLESAEHAATRLPGFVLLIGGAGEDLAIVRAAQAAGEPVRALGRLDGVEKALALKAADIMTIPQSIGLVAVDSLVAGRPIVTRDDDTHGPEADYIRNGLSVWLPGGSSPQAFGLAVVDTLESVDSTAALQAACRAAAPRYSLKHMVEAFVEGVLAWDDLRRFRW